jgi:hypothetical protein
MSPIEGLVFIALASLVGMVVISGMLVTAASYKFLVSSKRK